MCPRQDSNLRSRLRRAVLYPLSYGGVLHNARISLATLVSITFARRSVAGRRGSATLNDANLIRPSPIQPYSAGGGSGVPPMARSICSIWTTSALCALIIDWARSRTYCVLACCCAYCAIGMPPWW